MIRTLLGDTRSGRLQRLPYLGYYALIVLLFLVVAIGIGLAIGATERMIGGELVDAQRMIGERLGVFGMILIVAVFALLLFAQLNIAAKRVRDIGVPAPWLVLLGVLIVVNLISQWLGPQLAGALNLFVFLALLLVPSNAWAQGGGGSSL
jgi:uncharacterized membrane protein YhaH (DUF805 family)